METTNNPAPQGWFRRVFGPSRSEVWNQVAEQIGGQFDKGGFWNGTAVRVRHGEWTVTLDSYAVSTGKTTMVFTRLRAPYVNPEGFRFTIYRRSIFSDLGKFMGMDDVEIGEPQFDKDFIIKGTDPEKLRQLFASAKLRELVEKQPRIHLKVQDHEGWFGPEFPPDTDELRFAVPGIIKDPERLRALFELFAEVLDQLCRIGSAYKTEPQVKL